MWYIISFLLGVLSVCALIEWRTKLFSDWFVDTIDKIAENLKEKWNK